MGLDSRSGCPAVASLGVFATLMALGVFAAVTALGVFAAVASLGVFATLMALGMFAAVASSTLVAMSSAIPFGKRRGRCEHDAGDQQCASSGMEGSHEMCLRGRTGQTHCQRPRKDFLSFQ